MKNFRSHIIRPGEKIICWFSHGAASAVAAKITLTVFGKDHPVEVVNCDTTASEHPDNIRFERDCEKWLGVKITKLKNPDFPTGKVEDVFASRKYIAGIAGAVCTTQLKKIPRLQFAGVEDIHVFGFTADEKKRICDFEQRNPDMNLLWVLDAHGITKKRCYEELKNAGIELPAMYRLGFKNNNCIGCVKATSPGYWQKVRDNFPDVFESRAKQSREIGCRLVRVDNVRIFLDELPKNRNFRFENEDISCGPECGISNPK